MARSLSSLALLVGSLTHTLVASADTQPANSTNSPDPVGRIVRLVIEPIPDHAQLDSERQVIEVKRIDLPLFLDVQ